MPDDKRAVVDTPAPVQDVQPTPQQDTATLGGARPEQLQTEAKALHPSLAKLLGNLVYGQLTEPLAPEALAEKIYDIDPKYLDPVLKYLEKVGAKEHHAALKRDADQWAKDKAGVEAVYRAFDKVLQETTGQCDKDAVIAQFKRDFLAAVESGANGGAISDKGKRKLMGDGNFLNQIAYICGPKVYLELVPKLKFDPRQAKAIPGMEDPFALTQKDLAQYGGIVAQARDLMNKFWKLMEKIRAMRGLPSMMLGEEEEDLDILVSHLNAFPHPWLVAATYNARPEFGGKEGRFFETHLNEAKGIVGDDVRATGPLDKPKDLDQKSEMALMAINKGMSLDQEIVEARALAKDFRKLFDWIGSADGGRFVRGIQGKQLGELLGRYNGTARPSIIDQVYGQEYQASLQAELAGAKAQLGSEAAAVGDLKGEQAEFQVPYEEKLKVQQVNAQKSKQEQSEAAEKDQRWQQFQQQHRKRAWDQLYNALDELEDTCIDEGIVQGNLKSPWGVAKPEEKELTEFWVRLINDLYANDTTLRNRFADIKNYSSLGSYIREREGSGSEDALVEADLANYGHISLRTIAITSEGWFNDDEDRVYGAIESRSKEEREELLADGDAMKRLRGYLSAEEYRRVENALKGKLTVADIVATRSSWINTEETALNEDLKRYVANAGLTENLEAGYLENLAANKEQMAALFDVLDEDETLVPLQTLSGQNRTGAKGAGADEINAAVYGEGQGFWATFGANDPSYEKMLAAVKKMDDVERLALASDPRFVSWMTRVAEEHGGGNIFERSFKAGELMAYLETPKGDAEEAKLPIQKELILACGFDTPERATKALLALTDQELADLKAVGNVPATVQNMAAKSPIQCCATLRINDYWNGLVLAGYPERAIFRIDHAGDAGEANKEHYVLKVLMDVQDQDESSKKKVLDYLVAEDWLDNFPTDVQAKIERVLTGRTPQPKQLDPFKTEGQDEKVPTTEQERLDAAKKKQQRNDERDTYVQHEVKVTEERLNSFDLLKTASVGAGTDDPAITEIVDQVKGKDLLYNFSNIREWIGKEPGAGSVSQKVEMMTRAKRLAQETQAMQSQVTNLEKLIKGIPDLEPDAVLAAQEQIAQGRAAVEAKKAEVQRNKTQALALFGFTLDIRKDIYQSRLAINQLADSQQMLRDEIGGQALQAAVSKLRGKLKEPEKDPELYAELREIGFQQFMDPAYKTQMEASFEIDQFVQQRDIELDMQGYRPGDNLINRISSGDSAFYDGVYGQDYAQSGYELMGQFSISQADDGLVLADEGMTLGEATTRTKDLREKYQNDKAEAGALVKMIVQAVMGAIGTVVGAIVAFGTEGVGAVLYPAIIEAAFAAAGALCGGLAEHAIRGPDVAFEDYATEAGIEFLTTFAISLATAGLEKVLMPAMCARTAAFKAVTGGLGDSVVQKMATEAAQAIQKKLAYRIIKGGLSNLATGYMKGLLLYAADSGPAPGSEVWVSGLQGAFGGLMDGVLDGVDCLGKKTFWSSAAKNFLNKGTTGLFDVVSDAVAQDKRITDDDVRDALVKGLVSSLGATFGDMATWQLEEMEKGKTPAEVEGEGGTAGTGGGAADAPPEPAPPEPDAAVAALLSLSYEDFVKQFKHDKSGKEGRAIGKQTFLMLQEAFRNGEILTLDDMKKVVGSTSKGDALGQCAATMQRKLGEVDALVAQYEAALKLDDYSAFVVPGHDDKATGIDDFAAKVKEVYGIDIPGEAKLKLAKAAMRNSGISDPSAQIDYERSLGGVGEPDPFSRKPGEVYDEDLSNLAYKDLLSLKAVRDSIEGSDGPDSLAAAVQKMENPTDRQVLSQAWADLAKLVPQSTDPAKGSLTFQERQLIFEQTVAYLTDYRKALSNPSSKLPKKTPEQIFNLLVQNQRKLVHQTVTDKEYVTSSDHGVKHVLKGNMSSAEKMMEDINMPADLRILVRQATIDHDMGYTMAANMEGKGLVGRTSDHPLYSTALIDANMDKYRDMFGEEGAQIIRDAVLDHSAVKSDYSTPTKTTGAADQVKSVVSMADCMGATHDTKLATVMADPDVMAAMAKIHYLRQKAGGSKDPQTEADIKKIVASLKQTIEDSDYPAEVKARFTHAMSLLTQGDKQAMHKYYSKSNLSKIVGAQVAGEESIDDEGRVHATYQLDPNAAILRRMMSLAGASSDDAMDLSISGFTKILEDFNKANSGKEPLPIRKEDLEALAAGRRVTITVAHGVFTFIPPSQEAQSELMRQTGVSLKRDLKTDVLKTRLARLKSAGTITDHQAQTVVELMADVEDSYLPNYRFKDATGTVKVARDELRAARAVLQDKIEHDTLTMSDLIKVQATVDQIYLTGFRKDR